jgi:nucleoside-diphosphate-sugar epimerase
MAGEARPTILVSGASGVVGSALLRELVDYEVIGLVHGGRLADGGGRAEAVRADVSAERLGLDAHAYADLVARTDAIVHSAGLTDFTAPAHRHQRINVVGTERMLELASAAGAPIHHISTAWVQAMGPDAPLRLEPGNAIHAYVDSKATAERLVRDSGVPYSFYRPSNLIGDSQTGRVGASQFIPQLTLETLRGRLPLLPARPGARLDMVPDDVCARAIAACATAGEIGATHWLTYGAASPTIPELVEICADYARATGRPFTPPAVVDPDRPDEVEAQLARLPAGQRGLFPWLVQLSAGITAGGVFPSSLADLGERHGLPVPDLRDALHRGLEYLVDGEGALAPA